jgi:hypothetical protein
MAISDMVYSKLRKLVVIDSGNQKTEGLCFQFETDIELNPEMWVEFLAGESLQIDGQQITDSIASKLEIYGNLLNEVF